MDNSSGSIRLEDYGRQVIGTLKTLDIETIKKCFSEYFDARKDTKYFLLLSNRLGYYTVFKQTTDNIVDNLIDFLKDSSFHDQDIDKNIEMIEIKHLEINPDLNHLEIWIGKEYFQLFEFDWGVEEL
jgi:hypothetical protein